MQDGRMKSFRFEREWMFLHEYRLRSAGVEFKTNLTSNLQATMRE